MAIECEHLDPSTLGARFEAFPGTVGVNDSSGQEVFIKLRLSLLLGEGDPAEVDKYRSKPDLQPISDAVESCVATIEAGECPKWVVIRSASDAIMVPRDLARHYSVEE